jgi:hypothetical protein
MIDGVSSRPFSAVTLPPFPKPEKSYREKIIKVSRERYGTKKGEVEEKIARWMGTPATKKIIEKERKEYGLQKKEPTPISLGEVSKRKSTPLSKRQEPDIKEVKKAIEEAKKD